MSAQKAADLWNAALGDLQLQITRPSYETWLSGTVGLDCLDGQFVVGTPSPFVAEMLEQRMYSLISQALERVASHPLEVHFKVMSLDLSPTGDPTDGSPNGAHSPGDAHGQNGASDLHQPSPSALRRAVRLNTAYTFEAFVVGKSNELAHAAADAVSKRPGVNYNPLFIYSGVGLGKTHLLHAIGHRVMSQGLSLIYTTAEEFTNAYITAIREGNTEEFRNRYRSADVLLLDDIQFIIGKEQTQEGFFHTFNALHMAARQIVITSDRPVTSLTLLEDRVRSRLSGGLVVDVQPPDLETRLAILRAKAGELGQQFPDGVLEFLAERVHQNIRELEGCLNRVVAFVQLTQRPVTKELVTTVIADSLHSPNRRRITDEAVLKSVSSYFGIDQDTLRGRRRDKQTALARQVAMYLLREEANLSYATAGQVLGGKDHTTVLHACNRISRQLPIDAHLRQDVTNIRETLLAP